MIVYRFGLKFDGFVDERHCLGKIARDVIVVMLSEEVENCLLETIRVPVAVCLRAVGRAIGG